jgi:hypothetical protein
MFFFCTPRFSSSCNGVDFIDDYKLNHYFSVTVKIRVRYWYLLSEFMIYLSLFLNLVTVLDLYLMLFNPFKNTTKRPKNLVILSTMCSVVLAVVGLILTENKDENVSGLSDAIFIIMTIFNLVFASVVMIAVTKRLSSTGISKDLKA